MDGKARKLIDAAGAGRSVTSPGWLTELGRLWGGKSVRTCAGDAERHPVRHPGQLHSCSYCHMQPQCLRQRQDCPICAIVSLSTDIRAGSTCAVMVVRSQHGMSLASVDLLGELILARSMERALC